MRPIPFVFVALATIACSTTLVPLLTPRACSPQSLLLTTDTLPKADWAEGGTRASQNDAPFYEGIDRAGMQFSTPTGQIIVTQYLYRFRNAQHAEKRYPELEAPWFPQTPADDDPLFTPWSPIPDSDLNLPSYRRANAQCRFWKESGQQECAYIAQVGHFVVQMFANLPPMTLPEFISTISQAEAAIASCTHEMGGGPSGSAR
jgi:hypothetical protein